MSSSTHHSAVTTESGPSLRASPRFHSSTVTRRGSHTRAESTGILLLLSQPSSAASRRQFSSILLYFHFASVLVHVWRSLLLRSRFIFIQLLLHFYLTATSLLLASSLPPIHSYSIFTLLLLHFYLIPELPSLCFCFSLASILIHFHNILKVVG